VMTQYIENFDICIAFDINISYRIVKNRLFDIWRYFYMSRIFDILRF